MQLKYYFACILLLTGFGCRNVVIADPATFDLEPVYLGAVGQYEPLTYYPVAVALTIDAIWTIDLFRKEVQKLDEAGNVIFQFPIVDKWPRDIEIGPSGNIYIADSVDNKIRKYDSLGNLLLEIGGSGISPGHFKTLRAITIDSDGSIFTADSASELSVFSGSGDLIWNNMASVSALSNLDNPQGIDRDPGGNIYVADAGRNQIIVFDSNGNHLKNLGPTGPDWAFGGSVVGVSVATDGSIFVLLRPQQGDQGGMHQIFKLTSDGELINTWGPKGRGPGELWEAQGISKGPDGDIWVAGYQGHNIVRYDPQGNLIVEFNDHDIKPAKFAQVRGAVVGENANLYVTDFWNQVVHVFDRYGQFMTMWGERGQGDGQYFNFPRFTAVNDLDQFYVSDDREVRLFDADGTFVARSDWIIFPGGIEVDSAGGVWVSEQGRNTVRHYTSWLDLVEVFDGSTIPRGLNSPFGIVQGLNESLYIADTMNHRIVRMATDGTFELEFGSYGNDQGEFAAPVGIAADSEGRIYTSETWNKRIQVFSPDGGHLAGWDVPGRPEKDVGRVYELTMDGDYFLYAPDHTEGQAEVHKYALVPPILTAGQPNYTPGQDQGFYIWSEDGSNWHVRWSSDGVSHGFSGVVTSTVPFASISPVDFESGDQLQSASESRVEFNAFAANGQDGIDIVVNETGVIIFDLSVDGIENANLVTVGGGGGAPSTLPLPLKTQSGSIQNIDSVGQPDYVPGQNAGYYIWQDLDDGEWHLRWSGDMGNTYLYEGTVLSAPLINGVREYSFESNDSLTIVTTSEFSFSAAGGAGEDGIDFYVGGGAEVKFSLTANGNADVASVFIGNLGTNPSTLPFSLLSVAVSNPPMDAEAPTISITAPGDGVAVSGDVLVTVDAVDNIDIDKVTFAIDGAWVSRDDAFPYSFSWRSSTHANGIAKIQATAFDLAGNRATATNLVTVDNLDADTEAPTISITDPIDAAIVVGSVQVQVDALDNIGIDKVTFAIDGAWVGRDDIVPYSFNWKSSTHVNGMATIQATAFDLAGNQTTATTRVTVDNLDTDLEAPTISITDPIDEAIVMGSLQVQVDALDNIDIDKVTFAIDGAWVGRDDTVPYSFNWKSSTHVNGMATIQATAFDLAGNQTTATTRVTVDNLDTDTELPTISITDPIDAAIVVGSVQVQVDALDNIGIDKVTYAIDGAWVGRDDTVPYSFNWKSFTHVNGMATIQATAFDLAGNKVTATVFVTVSN